MCQRHVTWACMLQGVAFKEDVRGRVLVPAVCGGGAHNGQAHRISIVEPPFAFDTDQCAEYAASSGGPCAASHRVCSPPRLAARHVTLSEDKMRMRAGREWGSAGMSHSGMTHGKFSWSIAVTRKAKSGGICIGVVDRDRFNFASQNVGADRHSWGYSSLGKKSNGSPEFEAYGSPFGTNRYRLSCTPCCRLTYVCWAVRACVCVCVCVCVCAFGG